MAERASATSMAVRGRVQDESAGGRVSFQHAPDTAYVHILASSVESLHVSLVDEKLRPELSSVLSVLGPVGARAPRVVPSTADVKILLREGDLDAICREPRGDLAVQFGDRPDAVVEIGKVGSQYKAQRAVGEVLKGSDRRRVLKDARVISRHVE
jgi:hypothetical protein